MSRDTSLGWEEMLLNLSKPLLKVKKTLNDRYCMIGRGTSCGLCKSQLKRDII